MSGQTSTRTEQTSTRSGQTRTPGPAGPWPAGGVLGTYTNGKPCIKRAASGKGAYIHFAWQPGISFMSAGNTHVGSLSLDFA